MSEYAGHQWTSHSSDSLSVIVLAPTPQDAKYCSEILREHGLTVEIAASVYEVTRQMNAGVGVLLIAQEFMTAEAMEQLRLATDGQPSWSDIPLLVLLATTEPTTRQITDLLSLGNVTLMERPLRIALLVSTLKAKLRDRSRQYEVRELLHQAQQASRAKSEFVANISHEIRTPMTSILGYAELMTGLVDNEEALNFLSTIRRNGDFLLRIINDILDLSKIEAGKLDIEIERFELPQFLDDVRSDMENRAHEKGLKLEVEYASEIPESIESDPKRLRQILINLVGNAIKFTKKGSVKIIVCFMSSPAPETGDQAMADHLKFAISDSGIGMTPEQQERLFKPFSQGDAFINQQFGGTGLGLAISQRLAKMLNGGIGVESTLNKGSTFTLKIAVGGVKKRPLRKAVSQTASAGKAASTTDVRLDAHVLIVDDRRDIRFLSSRIVTMAGGHVTQADDGVRAIETYHQASAQGVVFDAILLDMQMPHMDGYETAYELRKLGYTNPIIALTADAMQDAVSKCLMAGCDHHLSKPINKNKLLNLLCELTSNGAFTPATNRRINPTYGPPQFNKIQQ